MNKNNKSCNFENDKNNILNLNKLNIPKATINLFDDINDNNSNFEKNITNLNNKNFIHRKNNHSSNFNKKNFKKIFI